MKFAVINFQGSTNHDDLIYVIKSILEQETLSVHCDSSKLPKIDAIIIPGGFQNLPCNDIRIPASKAPVMAMVKDFAKKGGFVFGIGTGFEVLCNTKMLPGKLLMNQNLLYTCKNIYIKPAHSHSSITALLDTNAAYKIPVSTLYGNYQINDETVRRLRESEQILFHYCDKDGHLTEEANPNGSSNNIAGICNKGKNVYGLLPQPERAVDDELGNTDGRLIFESIIAYLR
ncbi:MAG: phosphoribosylformylglycinamidine synthase I [Bacteroidales bacterium]